MEAWMEPSFFAYLLTYCSGEYSATSVRLYFCTTLTYTTTVPTHEFTTQSVPQWHACMRATDSRSFTFTRAR